MFIVDHWIRMNDVRSFKMKISYHVHLSCTVHGCTVQALYMCEHHVMITCLVSRLWKPPRLCSQLVFGCHSDNPCVIASVLRHLVTITAIMISGDDEPKKIGSKSLSNSLKVFIFNPSENKLGHIVVLTKLFVGYICVQLFQM